MRSVVAVVDEDGKMKWHSRTLEQYRCNRIVMHEAASTRSLVVSRDHLTIH